MHPLTVMRHFHAIFKLDTHLIPVDLSAEFSLEKNSLAVSSTLAGKQGSKVNHMNTPTSVTFVPQFGIFLIAEPSVNKIGVYEENFDLRSWLQVGSTRGPLENPSTLLCLDNGFIVILDQRNLHILDTSMSLCQTIPGTFYGLAEGPDVTLFTILQSPAKSILKVLKMDQNFIFKWSYATELIVAQKYPDWGLSSCNYLTINKSMVYISDTGLKNVYMVDLKTHYQSESPLSFEEPSGLMVDEKDNVLVADCCKIVICDSKLQVFRVLIDGLPFLCDILRHGSFVLAIQSNQTKSTIIKLQQTERPTDQFINSWFEKGLVKNEARMREFAVSFTSSF